MRARPEGEAIASLQPPRDHEDVLPSPGSPPSSTGAIGPVEVLDLRPDRRSALLIQDWSDRLERWPIVVRWVVGSAVALTVLGAYLLIRGGPAARSGASGGGPMLATDRTLAMIAASAHDGRSRSGYLAAQAAPAHCPLLPAGPTLGTRVAAAVRGVLPGYAVQDVAGTIDPLTNATCRVALRARNAHGSTVVVEVARAARPSTATFDHVVVASQLRGTTVVSMVSARTQAGWTVTVGAVGPLEDVPSSPVLIEIAESPALLW